MFLFDVHSFAVLLDDDVDSDDNLKEFSKKPIKLTAKKMEKRNISDLPSPTLTDFLARKKSRTVHASVLAIMQKSPHISPPTENGEPKIAEEIARRPSFAADGIKKVPKTVGKFHTHACKKKIIATYISIATHLCVFYVLPLRIEKELELIPDTLKSISLW